MLTLACSPQFQLVSISIDPKSKIQTDPEVGAGAGAKDGDVKATDSFDGRQEEGFRGGVGGTSESSDKAISSAKLQLFHRCHVGRW